VSPHNGQDSIQSTAGAPKSAPSPEPAASTPGDRTTPGTFSGLSSFPTDPYQTSELPPPESAKVEMTVGAVWGALLGTWFGGVVGFLVGTGAGLLAGKWVAYLRGGAGKFSAFAVAVNVFRVPFFTSLSIFYPFFTLYLAHRRDNENR
jgi:hypothetical protein